MGVLGRMATAQNTSDNQATYRTSTVETSNPTNTTNGGNGNGGERKKRHIILGARVGHWLGLAPSQIEGSRNPTLGFLPTERYTVTWINLDGKEHEFQILGQKNGENGQVLYRTGSSSNQGETRTLTFKPTDRIRRYRCRFHPDSMHGSINRSGQFGGGGGTFTTGTSGGTNTNTNQGTYNTRGNVLDTNTNQGTFNTRTTGTSTNQGTYNTRHHWNEHEPRNEHHEERPERQAVAETSGPTAKCRYVNIF